MKDDREPRTSASSPIEDFYMSIEDIELSSKELSHSQDRLKEYIGKFEAIMQSSVAIPLVERVDKRVAEQSFYSLFTTIDLLQRTRGQQSDELEYMKAEHAVRINGLNQELSEAVNLVNTTESQIVALKKKMDAAKTLRMIRVILMMLAGIISSLLFLNVITTLACMMIVWFFVLSCELMIQSKGM
jgi:hypothetical protein